MLNANEIETIYLRNQAEITRICAKYLGKRHGADCVEEFAQECAFLLIRRILPGYDASKGNVDAYVRTSVRNACISYLRTHDVSRRVEPVKDSEGGKRDPLDNLTSAVPTPFEAMARAELAGALERLTERQRALLSAYLATGSWSQAAATIGLAPSGATRVKAEAFAALRAMMAE